MQEHRQECLCHTWRPEGSRYGLAANWADLFNSASSTARSRNFPFKITAWIFWGLWMSASGLASRRTRSARLPGALGPCSLLRFRNSAGFGGAGLGAWLCVLSALNMRGVLLVVGEP